MGHREKVHRRAAPTYHYNDSTLDDYNRCNDYRPPNHYHPTAQHDHDYATASDYYNDHNRATGHYHNGTPHYHDQYDDNYYGSAHYDPSALYYNNND